MTAVKVIVHNERESLTVERIINLLNGGQSNNICKNYGVYDTYPRFVFGNSEFINTFTLDHFSKIDNELITIDELRALWMNRHGVEKTMNSLKRQFEIRLRRASKLTPAMIAIGASKCTEVIQLSCPEATLADVLKDLQKASANFEARGFEILSIIAIDEDNSSQLGYDVPEQYFEGHTV